MGTWGAGMFQDDMVCNLVDSFEEAMVELRNPALISQTLLAEYQNWYAEGGINQEELDSYLLVLAAVELKYDALQPDIRELALELLAKGGDLEQWMDSTPQMIEERRAVLEELQRGLLNFSPAQRKEKLFSELPQQLHAGDVIAFDYTRDKIAIGLVLHTPKWHERAILVGFYDQSFNSLEEINLADLEGNFILPPVYTLDYVNIVIHKMTPWVLVGHQPALLDKIDLAQMIQTTPPDLFRNKERIELKIFSYFKQKARNTPSSSQVTW